MGHKTVGFPGVAPGTRRGALAAPSLGPKGGSSWGGSRARGVSEAAARGQGVIRGVTGGGRDAIPRQRGTSKVRRPRRSGLGIPPARSPARPHALLVRNFLRSERMSADRGTAAMSSLLAAVERFPRVRLGHAPTPLDPAPRLGAALGVELWVKRDDCTGLAFGGNKVRQIEFHFGEAQARRADTVLATGAVQSNLVRLAAAGARPDARRRGPPPVRDPLRPGASADRRSRLRPGCRRDGGAGPGSWCRVRRGGLRLGQRAHPRRHARGPAGARRDDPGVRHLRAARRASAKRSRGAGGGRAGRHDRAPGGIRCRRRRGFRRGARAGIRPAQRRGARGDRDGRAARGAAARPAR